LLALATYKKILAQSEEQQAGMNGHAVSVGSRRAEVVEG
jgi:hypothetical protein